MDVDQQQLVRMLKEQLTVREKEVKAWRDFALHKSGAYEEARALDRRLSTDLLSNGGGDVGADFVAQLKEEYATRAAETEKAYKVVLNCAFGGFGLSMKALERISELTGVLCDDKRLDIPRHHWALVRTVEELRWKAHSNADDSLRKHEKCSDEDWGALKVVELKGDFYEVTEYDGYEGVQQPGEVDWKSAEDGYSTAELDDTRFRGIFGDHDRSLEDVAETGTWVCDECSKRKPRDGGPDAWRQLIFLNRCGYEVRSPHAKWWCDHCKGLSAEALRGERQNRERFHQEGSLIWDARMHDTEVDDAKAELENPSYGGTEEEKSKKRKLDELTLEYGDRTSAMKAQRQLERYALF